MSRASDEEFIAARAAENHYRTISVANIPYFMRPLTKHLSATKTNRAALMTQTQLMYRQHAQARPHYYQYVPVDKTLHYDVHNRKY